MIQTIFPDPQGRRETDGRCYSGDKRVGRYREECGSEISASEVLVVKSFGDITFCDKSGQYKTIKGNHYIHSSGDCLKKRVIATMYPQ